jgi:hypothetical protein
MSRKVFVVAALVTLVLATLAAPVMAALPEADDTALVQPIVWSGFSDGSLGLPPPSHLNGACETGGAGGCS